MANIQERRNKNGTLISYSIRVHRGRGPDGKQLKPFTETFRVEPGWSEKTAAKKAAAFAATYEEKCKKGLVSDSRITLQEYCEYVISLKADRGAKASTISGYRDLTARIYRELGYIKLRELRPDQINTFYSKLAKEGERLSAVAIATPTFHAAKRALGLTAAELARRSGLNVNTVYNAIAGKNIALSSADKLAEALYQDTKDAFEIKKDLRPLSPKTILEYHHLLSTVLEHAVKEGLVPSNVVKRVDPPKQEKPEPNYFEPHEIISIAEALEKEPLKRRAMTLLLMASGIRLGELMGLKWSCVDWANNTITINNCVYYRRGFGLYQDTPKSENANRIIDIPELVMDELAEYREYQWIEQGDAGDLWQENDLCFPGRLGAPMHPGSYASWLANFSKRHNLPHINPHAFLHTMASLLYFNHADAVSISRRLGHSKVSTTQDIYAHLYRQADKRNSDILNEAIFQKLPPSNRTDTSSCAD